MSQVYAVTSGKGGVGKSTVSVGLALAFCRQGKQVLLVDMDEGLRCLDLMLGVDSAAIFDLSDILQGTPADQATYEIPGVAGLRLIPAPCEPGTVTPDGLRTFLEGVSGYDIILFDFPAGIDFTLYRSLPGGTVFLTVATADPVSVRDAAAVSTRLEEAGCIARLILNRFCFRRFRRGGFGNIDEIIDQSGLRLIGVIPESQELKLFAVRHTMKSRGKPSRAFARVADRLSGEPVRLPNLKKI